MNAQVPESNQAVARSKDQQDSPEKPATRKLARAHYLILSQMAANPGNPLRKLPGGFWVVDPDLEEYPEGAWYASTNAVAVMTRHGFLSHLPDRANAVELTPIGVEALRSGVYTPLGTK